MDEMAKIIINRYLEGEKNEGRVVNNGDCFFSTYEYSFLVIKIVRK